MNVLGLTRGDGWHSPSSSYLSIARRRCVVSECVAAFAGWCAVDGGGCIGCGSGRNNIAKTADSSERWVITSR